MATVVPWLGPTVGGTATTEIVGQGAASTLYPFCDPIFSPGFTVQSYLTLGSAGAVQTYDAPAPEKADTKAGK